MEISVDASSLINLARAGALEVVFGIPGYDFLISPLVAGECDAECVLEIVRLTQFYSVALIADEDIDAELYVDLLATHALGEGETESIATCLSRNCKICCDDRKARRIASELLGENFVTGSLGLLKLGVDAGRVTPDEAWNFYEIMKLEGGFLPDLERNWFE